MKDLPALLREVARVTRGRFIATVRAIRSTPSIYVDSVKAATASRQDHSRGKLNGEFSGWHAEVLSSHLLSAAEIQALAEPALVIDDMCGLICSMGGSPGTLNGTRQRPSLQPQFLCASRFGASLQSRSVLRRSCHAFADGGACPVGSRREPNMKERVGVHIFPYGTHGWCARRADGLVCGYFVDQVYAVRFARREIQVDPTSRSVMQLCQGP